MYPTLRLVGEKVTSATTVGVNRDRTYTLYYPEKIVYPGELEVFKQYITSVMDEVYQGPYIPHLVKLSPENEFRYTHVTELMMEAGVPGVIIRIGDYVVGGAVTLAVLQASGTMVEVTVDEAWFEKWIVVYFKTTHTGDPYPFLTAKKKPQGERGTKSIKIRGAAGRMRDKVPPPMDELWGAFLQCVRHLDLKSSVGKIVENGQGELYYVARDNIGYWGIYRKDGEYRFHAGQGAYITYAEHTGGEEVYPTYNALCDLPYLTLKRGQLYHLLNLLSKEYELLDKYLFTLKNKEQSLTELTENLLRLGYVITAEPVGSRGSSQRLVSIKNWEIASNGEANVEVQYRICNALNEWVTSTQWCYIYRY